MKFAHMADVHIGSWRDPKLRDISTTAFEKAIEKCVNEKVDFVLISGDLFNTALPTIDRLKIVVLRLKELRERGIPVYIIPGSHDFSPSGKTMLDVLEHADLLVNVVKGDIVDGRLKLRFTTDAKTGVKITGMLGKKGMLEKSYYENLVVENLEEEEGFKIFMFHTALTEFKTKEFEKMDSSPLSLLPKRFNYYAGGHVHYIKEFDKSKEGYGKIIYPGPLFPANFLELEKFGSGGFYIYEDGKLEYHPIQVYNVFSIKISAENKTPEQAELEINQEIKGKEFFNTIVTIRVEGVLSEGKPSDIDFKEVFETLYDKSAYFVMKNTHKLNSKEFKEIKISSKSVEELERDLIKEHIGQFPIPNVSKEGEVEFINGLIKALDIEKIEGERVHEYESRIIGNVEKVIEKKE